MSDLGNTASGARITARETVTISLEINGRTAAGWLTARASVLGGSTVIDYCATGTVTFTARR